MSGSDTARPAVFLDRDGTLIEEIDYLADPDAVRLIPGAAEAVRRLNELGRAVVIVTNQSGVARGILDLAVLDAIHAEVERRLAAEGAHLDAIESCPHHPDHDGDHRHHTDHGRRDRFCRRRGQGHAVQPLPHQG